MELNIKSMVRVKLNSIGMAYLEMEHEAASSRWKREEARLSFAHINRIMASIQDGQWRAPLWEVMQVLGPYFTEHGDPPIGMIIIVEET